MKRLVCSLPSDAVVSTRTSMAINTVAAKARHARGVCLAATGTPMTSNAHGVKVCRVHSMSTHATPLPTSAASRSVWVHTTTSSSDAAAKTSASTCASSDAVTRSHAGERPSNASTAQPASARPPLRRRAHSESRPSAMTPKTWLVSATTSKRCPKSAAIAPSTKKLTWP